MSRYNVIKTATDAYIKRNGRREITGPILNSVLNAIIDSLGKFYQFVGVATPSTNPGSPDQNVAFVAATAGTYANMGGVVLASGEMAVIKWDGTWVKETILILPEGSESNVFIATYGETHIADITAAYNAGKLVIVNNGKQTFFPALMDGEAEEYTFFAFDEVDDIYSCYINENDVWSAIQNVSFVQWGSTIKQWTAHPNEYTIPVAKLVYDSINARYEKPSGGIPSTDMDAAVQTSLGKANTAVQPGDLAPVATSGDYNDLENKPTIPAAQVQSDWDEADNTEPSFIRNKPSIGKMGVIRQTQTWTQAADGGYDYVMSNPFMGLIPQANIDLYEAAGATFNAVTGYFELNGLTDLSYEEMQAVYDANFSAKMMSMNIANALRIVKPARTVNLSDGVVYFSASLNNALRVGSGGDGAGDSSIEVVAVGTIGGYPSNASSIQQFLYKCPYVKRVGIFQPINFTSTSQAHASLAFQNCFSLEDVMLRGLAVSIEIKQSPRLTAASLAYIINNAGTAAITITLHATAYARATADAGVQAALAAKTNVTLASA